MIYLEIPSNAKCLRKAIKGTKTVGMEKNILYTQWLFVFAVSWVAMGIKEYDKTYDEMVTLMLNVLILGGELSNLLAVNVDNFYFGCGL